MQKRNVTKLPESKYFETISHCEKAKCHTDNFIFFSTTNTHIHNKRYYKNDRQQVCKLSHFVKWNPSLLAQLLKISVFLFFNRCYQMNLFSNRYNKCCTVPVTCSYGQTDECKQKTWWKILQPFSKLLQKTWDKMCIQFWIFHK